MVAACKLCIVSPEFSEFFVLCHRNFPKFSPEFGTGIWSFMGNQENL